MLLFETKEVLILEASYSQEILPDQTQILPNNSLYIRVFGMFETQSFWKEVRSET